MPQLSDGLRRPLALRFQRSLSTVVVRTTPALQRAWDGLDDYDEHSVAVLTAKASNPLTAVKVVAIAQAVGFYTVVAGVRSPRVTAAEISTAANLRAPFISVWQVLASGNSYDDALAAGRSRIEAVVSDFAVSSARQAGDVFVAKANLRVHGWERIPDAKACAWCLSVAPGHYKSADSADFGHDGCGCTAALVFD